MNIAIWGAGGFGKKILEKLANKDIEVECFIDNHPKDSEISGIKIVTPSTFQKEEYNVELVLVAISDTEGIIDQLNNLGIKKYGIIHHKVFVYDLELQDNVLQDNNILWSNEKEFQMPWLETLEINLVDFCNMNCKGCSHFSNLFHINSKTNYEVFERDVKRLAAKVFIKQFNLLGGEVFLCEDLCDYILCIRKYMPKTKIELISNGLLIPKQDEITLKVIEKNNVTISITEYPPVTRIKHKILEKLEKYNIAYIFRPSVDSFGKNIDLSGNNDPVWASHNCREYKCQFLREGKIYKCPFSALGNYFFQYYNIPLKFDEGYDIFDENINWEYLAKNIRKEPIELCRFCGKEERFKWEISNNPDKNEWLINFQ